MPSDSAPRGSPSAPTLGPCSLAADPHAPGAPGRTSTIESTRMGTKHIPAQVGDLPPIGRPANGALLEAGITTLQQVASVGRRELLAMHGVGPKAVSLLAAALEERGLDLAP